MAKNVVGIDIGSTSIRAVEVARTRGNAPSILRIAEVPLPIGSTSRGEVLEPNTVAAALRELWAVGRFRTKDVALGMGNQRVLSRDLTVPKAPLAQIRESLPFQVQDLLPVPVGEAILDFYPIAEGSGEGGPVVHGLLVAAIKDAVLANVRAVQLAGLHPVGVDLIPFALSRVLAPTDVPAAAIVELGGNATTVVIARHGVPHFVRIIPTGGDEVTKQIAVRLEISLEQAEVVKRWIGTGARAQTADDVRAAAVVREATNELIASIRNTLNYFVNTKGDGAPIARLVLAGAGSGLPGFGEALAETTGVPTVVGDPFTGVHWARSIAPEVVAERGQSMAVAWGLAAGGRAA
ncbi:MULTISPECIES: type IV pilus assembly protein PilM [Curtobacterium]|uniref:type IV pilus assembly protein PilM n=1 Tax=Curtobacterium TaxID=2034 RepID=UPI001580B1F9|nr:MULTISPECIES: type IV pilus assembly protein PilM [Curtobacterium]MDK8173145.1 type IV pilus assembly protein PilM [Curtobacterium citreum]QKS15094.1 type IV pilus assembly protein PilM [Curtobacterium sp. Csp2]WIJ45141.1 type IV pilus assembly protein PilM [Curtobacterium citreum]